MSNKQAAKINMSGLQVMKTLLVLLNDNYFRGNMLEQDYIDEFGTHFVLKEFGL